MASPSTTPPHGLPLHYLLLDLCIHLDTQAFHCVGLFNFKLNLNLRKNEMSSKYQNVIALEYYAALISAVSGSKTLRDAQPEKTGEAQ